MLLLLIIGCSANKTTTNTNIAHYKVVNIGDVNGDIVLELVKSGDTISVNIQ